MSSQCTPAYNEETKRLMREAKQLDLVNKGFEDGDFTKAIRAKAKEFAEKEKDAVKVRDATHDYINQFAPHTKREVADIISGYGKQSNETKSDLQQRVEDIKKELRALSRAEDSAAGIKSQAQVDRETERRIVKSERASPFNKEVADNRRRQKQLDAELKDIQRRIAKGDFSKAGKRDILYDNDTFRLERERNTARREYEDLLRRREAQNDSVAKKTADVMHSLHMASILSSVHVYPKLAAAVIGRWVGTGLEDLSVSIAKHIPGMKRWADLAQRHTGINLGSDAYAYSAGLKNAAVGFKDQLSKGRSNLDEMFGEHRPTLEYTDYMGGLRNALHDKDYLEAAKIVGSLPGRSHAAIKEFASQVEFARSFYRRDQKLRETMKAKGVAPDKIDAYMQLESTKAMIGAKAYADSLAAKQQEKIKFADSVNSFLVGLENGGAGEKALAFAFKSIFPIRKVPISIVKEITSYSAGAVKALTRMRGDFTEENAEYIMKNLGKQGAGLMLFGIGYLGASMFGGIPGAEPKKKTGVTPGEAMVGGVNLGTEAFHGPAATLVQLGAGFRHLFEREYGKSHDAVSAGLQSIGNNYSQLLIRDIPYLDQPRRWMQTAENAPKYDNRSGVSEIVGNQIRSMVVPQAIQQYARAKDKFTGFRHPRNMKEDVELGIPGLRENVPTQKQR